MKKDWIREHCFRHKWVVAGHRIKQGQVGRRTNALPDQQTDQPCLVAPKNRPLLIIYALCLILKPGAAEGQGLGNAFLSNIKACDAIFHVTRAFEDEDITHVEGGVDPVRDLAIIAEELRLKVGDIVIGFTAVVMPDVLKLDKAQK